MNSTIYKIVSIIGFTISGIMFLVTSILFVRLNILKLIDELTGRKAQREIQEISQQTMTYKTGGLKKKRNGASADVARGMLQGRLESEKTGMNVNYLKDEDVTTPLFNNQNSREDDAQFLEETEMLNETQLLAKTDKLEQWTKVPIKDVDAAFEIVKDEILIHTEDTAETEVLQD